ncbi:ligand-gated channel [Xenophilus sp. AP218F]|nr:ligand-gated channel [Xenophilus sp. AP218F]
MKNQKKQLAIALALIGFGSHAPIVFADGASSVNQLDRVEVTGSNIKRSIKQEKALPVTVVKTEELTKQGLSTVEEVVNSLAANQSSLGANAAVGASTGGAAYASLRGLGSQYTLVLLDGKRMANQAIGGYAVDLNAIPLAVIDRVEVLRDGASAIYGTDAIGGVINFITKKTLKGLQVGGELMSPQHAGGKSANVNIAYGYGDLAKDGFNVYGAIDYKKNDAVGAMDRNFASTITKDTKTSASSYPGSYYDPSANGGEGGLITPNPAACKAPYAIYKGGYCQQYYSLFPNIIPEVEQSSGFFKASKRLGDDHELSLQYAVTQTKTTSVVAPAPIGGDDIQLPGGTYGGVTLPAGTYFYVRGIPMGNRISESTATTQRLMLNLEGLIGGWDYRAGLGRSQNNITQDLVSGYPSFSRVSAGLSNGTFDPLDSSGKYDSVWRSLSLTGEVQKAKSTIDMIDGKISKEVYQLPAGMLAVAFGAEYRKESISQDFNYPISRDALSLGMLKSESASGSRSAYAVYGEADVPVLKDLDAQLAVRYDRYSDFGSSVNPKAALKYQPIPQVLFRTSASTGFRAPTLYDINNPVQQQLTEDNYQDPVYCPNGVAQPGAGPTACTKVQRYLRTGGNKNLQPEKSTSLTFGVVLEPIPSITTSADLWWTMVKNQIGVLPESKLFGDPAKYSKLYNRDPSNNNLLSVDGTTQNLGNLSAAGIDLNFNWRLPRTSVGNFTLNLDGTYISKYSYQLEEGGDYFSNLGSYRDTGVTFRWQHNLSLNWNYDKWSAILAQDYKSGYTDQNKGKQGNSVRPYSTWNLSASYALNKQASVTAGVRNLFDQLPPYSNQGATTQQGYDPRYTDPLGRAYFIKASYKM